MNTPTVHKVLVFNCNKPRSPVKLLTPIVEMLKSGQLRLDHVVFCVPKVEQQANDKSNYLAQTNYTTTSWQQYIADEWKALAAASSQLAHPPPLVQVHGSINSVYRFLEELSPTKPSLLGQSESPTSSSPSYTVEVLLAGSLYLAGAALEVANYPTAQ